jgi:ubiquinone/menaquinone biosynthesis C-methylase UbiE
MAKFHFVEDYENYVASLLAKHPIDEAMSLAVGGDYLAMGSIQRDVVLWAGLEPGMSFVDFGCGSGRLAVSLARALPINYHGIDIVRSLLDYAASKCPPSYRFSLNHSLSLPVADGAADFISAFSVFTHLLPSEIYIYLEDMHRALRPGGTVVFSFMEVADPEHWGPFMSEVAVRRGGPVGPINTLIERPFIQRMCTALDFTVHFVDSLATPWKTAALGQSIAVLRRPR